ncbi:MAG: DUF2203 domain-containing protein [Terriglobia bacterium]
MAEKYFKREEAEELLPVIEYHLEQARAQSVEMERLSEELSRAAARVMALGGSVPPLGKLAGIKAQREQLLERLKQAVAHIQDTGCILKDLETGLIDFPSFLNGQEIYLCWKLGEEHIEWWHGIHEGFAGRKRLGEAPPDEPPPKNRVQ